MNRLIAIPRGRKGDYLDFWYFVRDDGRALDRLPNYTIRFIWHKAQEDRIKKILLDAKKDYLQDIARFCKERDRQTVHTSKSIRGLWSARAYTDKFVKMDSLEYYGL